MGRSVADTGSPTEKLQRQKQANKISPTLLFCQERSDNTEFLEGGRVSKSVPVRSLLRNQWHSDGKLLSSKPRKHCAMKEVGKEGKAVGSTTSSGTIKEKRRNSFHSLSNKSPEDSGLIKAKESSIMAEENEGAHSHKAEPLRRQRKLDPPAGFLRMKRLKEEKEARLRQQKESLLPRFI